ncbi:MAG TPA: type II toxin-antitoxin system RatA family toxin [Steroidobacteraceae bacterium]|nr:type II toxin-antitoxin system RatA family toxin [Steroidobacteraceae bacterium]
MKRSALVPYTAEQMFALVEDIERYPLFLPWVAAAQVLERSASEVVGRLEMHRAGMREIITTRNTLTPPREIALALVSGPFKTLTGHWTFEPIGADRGARVSLVMRFEFANAMLNLLLSRTFEKSCNELVDAFVARARAVYGAR